MSTASTCTHSNSSLNNAPDSLRQMWQSLFIYDRLKRVSDIVIAMAALIVLSPMLAMVALMVKFTDFGPIFFVQTRIGKDGVPFSCLKFRSMRVNADELKAELMGQSHHADNRTFKMAKDPRITKIGRIIRKFSIDEMPQLWNVVRGDMSIVGPRPSCPQEVAVYHHGDWERLTVKPGLTCIWQVCGRGDIPFNQQVKMDLEYVESRSLQLDFKLMFMTIPAVVFARGAY
ncbi:UDP-glucose:undecaprenyl-phosphate glucose-1-phosphate transferase [Rubripirellula tenax]|uniref:UDP-glucose:undecaprenyl-phosphate glucose-1-phosphate transferase n=1 Tax=Rubripirellula tenax TaxID=2528015 RepID=A0A5C6F533_9BACT|nr:sugar transferase [Rubripirellula tenax]TWU56873.1 UDP-glucose:undecaprenyl-phosphate glucose-1-phosphate transferase [Rubripirellula tenax]